MNDQELRDLERKSKFFQTIKQLFDEEDVFWNNEIMANIYVSMSLLILGGILIGSYILTVAGVFEVPIYQMQFVLAVNIPMILITCAICRYFKGCKHWLKYLLCVVCICIVISLCATIRIFVALIICIPVVLSTRYYSRKFTIFVAILSVIAFAVSEVIYATGSPLIDLNLVTVASGSTLNIAKGGLRAAVITNGYNVTQYLIDIMRGSLMPDLLLFFVIANICVELARRAHDMVLDQEEVSKKTEGMKVELEMANSIQTAVMPKIFPAFPTRPEIDIFASMNPAKEVGGDFYDYYFIDDDHLAVVIADVSGKGIPAALFMMISKALIKTYANVYKDPARVAAEVNKQLCEENEVDMFVTAWIGILEVSTGIITAVDCGHEYPLLRHLNGDFEVVKQKKSFVLGGMDLSKYHNYTIQMTKGDTLFLYTDGVPEATNASKELYGMTRLQNILNQHKSDAPKELLESVKTDVDAFVQEAPQFDDLTMVGLSLTK